MNPWVITIFAALVVIAGGWFLGQALARVFNGQPKTEKVAQAPTTQPILTPPPSASPQASAPASPSAAPSPTHSPKPTPEPSPTATAEVTTAPVQTAQPTAQPTATTAPTASPAATPSPSPATRRTQPIARRPEPSSAPAAQSANQGTGEASRIVRGYIESLRAGNPEQASTYLGNGSPDETFIDSSTRIVSISESANGDGSYKVSADMQTTKGEYYETFIVASGKILDKTAIKP